MSLDLYRLLNYPTEYKKNLWIFNFCDYIFLISALLMLGEIFFDLTNDVYGKNYRIFVGILMAIGIILIIIWKIKFIKATFLAQKALLFYCS